MSTMIAIAISPAAGGGIFPNPPYPAPAGYRWAFVYEGTSIVYEDNQRVIELVVIT